MGAAREKPSHKHGRASTHAHLALGVGEGGEVGHDVVGDDKHWHAALNTHTTQHNTNMPGSNGEGGDGGRDERRE